MKYILSILSIFTPAIALAAFNSLSDVESFVVGLVNQIVGVLVTFIVVVFLWGMVKVIWLSTDGESKTEAYRLIRYSLISLFVVTSLWGILQVASNTFFD